MAKVSEEYDTISRRSQQESLRPLSALRVRQCQSPPSATISDIPTPTSLKPFNLSQERFSRPSSKRLSMELDELLKWEGFSRSSFVGKGENDSVKPTAQMWDYTEQAADHHNSGPINLDLGDSQCFSAFDDMLASARKKLDLLDYNLKGARDSLYMPPTLPSPPSTGSLRSTISSTLSHTFSALSEEDYCLETPPSGSATTTTIFSDNPADQYNHTSTENNTASSASLNTAVDGNSSSENISPTLSIENDHPTTATAETHCRAENTHATLSSNPNEVFSRPRKVGSCLNTTEGTFAYQAKLDSLSSIRSASLTATQPQTVDGRRLSTGSNATSPATSPVAVFPRLRPTADLTVAKHASISTFASSATETTESYSSGWDSDSDSDTEELLHDEFEGTWPMPPASSGTKPRFACSHITPAPRLAPQLAPLNIAADDLRLTLSAAIADYHGDDGSITPCNVNTHSSRDLTTPTPTTSRAPQARRAPLPDSAPQPPTQSDQSAHQVDSKALSAQDQALAFMVAESMHEACLWLRDGSDVQKNVWRDRMERARRVLRGES